MLVLLEFLMYSICLEKFDFKEKADPGSPVHDVGQPVHADGVGCQQRWVEDSGWGHHHQGQPVLQEGVAHLQEQKPG